MKKSNKSYDLVEHRIRFASWAAATAARSSRKCRFSRAIGFSLIRRSTLSNLGRGWDYLPNPAEFDAVHKKLRKELRDLASSESGISGEFSVGVAAKLINVFLKTIYVMDSSADTHDRNVGKRNAIHPPIDRFLLNALAKDETSATQIDWKIYLKAGNGWSQFGDEAYQTVIDEIREMTGGRMWEVEKFWLPNLDDNDGKQD